MEEKFYVIKKVMENKRKASVLIPYKIENNKIFIFLQKRDGNAKILPNCFSFFGGGIEKNESPEDALKREIKEELNLSLKNYQILGIYHPTLNEPTLLNVYFTKVKNNFEDEITINEGEYGKFFSKKEAISEPTLINKNKIIIKDLYKLLEDNEQ